MYRLNLIPLVVNGELANVSIILHFRYFFSLNDVEYTLF